MVGPANDRSLMLRMTVSVMAIPHVGSLPEFLKVRILPGGAILIFAVAPVVDIEIYRMRSARVIVRFGHEERLVQSLFLKGPPDDFPVTATDLIRTRPVTQVSHGQTGRI